MRMEYRKFSKFIEKVQYGFTADETSTISGDAKYLRITDIVPYFVDKDRVPYCTIPQKKKEQYLVKENDLLIARTGATTGYNLIIPKGFEDYIFASYLVRIYYNQRELYPLYLKHVLKSQQYYSFVNNYIGGSAQPGMNPRAFGRFEVPYFDYDQQKQIAAVLSTYNNLIELNNKRIKVLEQMAENLYKEWFVRFRFPGHESVPFENGLPKGWTRDRISKYYLTSSGGTPSREHDENFDGGTIPWIKTGELQDCLIIDTEEHITETAVKKSSAKKFSKDSVLMAMYGVNIGMLAYSTIEATCNQACCVFTDKGKESTKHYLFQHLKSIRDYLLLIGFGAAQQNLSQDLIKRVKIVRPDKETIARFEQSIEPLYNETKHLLSENRSLIKQRDLLLPRLMSEKLEVK